jgi:hypothetical protein
MIMTAEKTTVTDSLHLVRAEYLEMPGLVLTKAQVQRLCGLEDRTCDVVLEQLTATHFLKRTAGDVYVLDALDR